MFFKRMYIDTGPDLEGGEVSKANIQIGGATQLDNEIPIEK